MVLANLSKREKTLFYLTVTVILLSLIYVFVVKPGLQKWGQLNRQIVNKEIELKRNIKYLQQQEQAKEIYRKYAKYIKKRGSDEEEMAALLNAVEEAARRSDIRIANMRPKPIKESNFYKKYILEMDCEASMEKYVEFIYSLQKSAQLVRAEKLKLSSQGRANPLLKARLLITKVLIAK